MTTTDRAPYEGMLVELVPYSGHNNETIYGYLARPLGPGPFPAVVVIHHAPGWDEETKEFTRKFAAYGYIAFCPNLYYREGPATPVEATAIVRGSGGVPDDRCIGDIDGAVRYLRSLLSSNGKVGVIGHCSGGRQVYLVACNIPSLDAAVDCYGGRVVATPEQITPIQPVAPIEMSENLACPLLGLFGLDDLSPSADDVVQTEAVLKRLGKTYEFHSYPGAGHSFFSAGSQAYRQEAATEGWGHIFRWFGQYLSS
ncbi:MAG: dienelactone hydrolase family protein [Dehalococcoidia bacterium]